MAGLFQDLDAISRQQQFLPAAIHRRRLALEKIAALQAIDQCHHCGAIHAELVGDVDLAHLRIGSDEFENGKLLLGEADVSHGRGIVLIDGDIGHAQMEAEDLVETAGAQGSTDFEDVIIIGRLQVIMSSHGSSSNHAASNLQIIHDHFRLQQSNSRLSNPELQNSMHNIQFAEEALLGGDGRMNMQPEFLAAATEMRAVGLETDDPLIYRATVSPERQAAFEVTTGRSETYASLDDAVGRGAALIAELVGHAAPSQRIAYLGRNSIDQIIVCLACQRAGHVFVPLNWRLGASELGQIIADCEPAVLLHDAEFAPVLGNIHQPLPRTMSVEGDGGWGDMLRSAKRAEPVPTEADAACIMLYTSGTTGSPKGVIITRRNAFASAVNFALVGEVTNRSVTLCDLPFFHTIGLVAIGRTTLTMGGRLVISDRFLPDRTLATLGDPELGVTHYFAVPQMASALRNAPAWDPSALKALQAIFIGGAPLSPALIEAFLEDGIPLVNGYGMSEAGTAIHMPLDRDAVARHPGSVGFPAPLLAVRLVGEDGQDVADGEVGEIWLKGPSVTPGYWNKPGETARAFVGDWYRTGDLGRRAEGGVIHVPDRLKDMYITGGENVFPAEIEAVIGAHPKVRDVAVLGLPDPKWGECGVAFIVAHVEAPSADEILAHCAERLASYKRPTRIVFLDQIPRTASGKAQKHILRQTHAEL